MAQYLTGKDGEQEDSTTGVLYVHGKRIGDWAVFDDAFRAAVNGVEVRQPLEHDIHTLHTSEPMLTMGHRRTLCVDAQAHTHTHPSAFIFGKRCGPYSASGRCDSGHPPLGVRSPHTDTRTHTYKQTHTHTYTNTRTHTYKQPHMQERWVTNEQQFVSSVAQPQ